jgi:hypothetical protein
VAARHWRSAPRFAMVALDAETTPGAAALRLPLAFAAALAAAPLVADEAGTPIPPEEWRAMTRGKTVWYALDGAHWGREYFHPDSDVATFLGRDGQCLSAPWAHVDGVYCFAYGGLHCFRHLRRGEEIVVIPVDGDGGEQTVERIDRTPVSCEAPLSS